MTTLTRILINPASRGGGRLLTRPQAMHAAVRACFPPDLEERHGRVLWRLDANANTYTLYIVGPEEPDRAVIVDQAGWASRPGETADYGRFLDSLVTNQEWAFRLTANPVRSLPSNGAGRGRVVPHVTPEQQVEWLRTQQDRHGFDLIDVRVDRRRDLAFVKGRPDEKQRVTLRTAQFNGLLRVTDPHALRSALVLGIGRGRAYGCGLLTLARPTAD